jgi:ATP-dependent DNA helicase RecG
MATFASPLAEILGGKSATALAEGLDLNTVGDLLRHYPRRFAERGELTDLRRLVEGEQVTVFAEIAATTGKRIPGRKLHILEVTVASGNTKASLSFFNQPWRERELRPGRRGLFAGKVTRFRNKLQLNSPEYVFMDEAGSSAEPGEPAADLVVEEFAGALIPVYPAAAGVPSWTIARCVKIALDSLDPPVDPLPSALRRRQDLQDLELAIHQIHRPDNRGTYRQARQRLAFDEAFGVQLILAQRRHEIAANPAVARPPRSAGLVEAFGELLPFSFTLEQAAVAELLSRELAAEHPMHRLLQGEVGSGKTVVALRAMLQVVDAGGQAALLAPTEVLAGQHAATIGELLGPLARAGELGGDLAGTKLTLLTGSMSAPARRAALLDIASGAAGIVIGTHALISDVVQFADLGLVVVDEQHRFGVEQRDALRAKASAPPHMLVMTATPIPRTVAMTAFGDLEVSEIRRVPEGRQKIGTSVVGLAEHPGWADRLWQRTREEVAKGRQVYVVCPRIGEATETGQPDDIGADSDDAAAQSAAVLTTHAELNAGPLAGLRVGLLHGGLPAEEKSAVMADLASGHCDVLVATTVIEVGISVENATTMIVLDADRFGISQLHQLRGRVGRGAHEGLCLLVTRMPDGHPARARLEAVAATLDGFELAEVDLRQRREGDVLGVSQSGSNSHLKLLSLLDDLDLISAARAEAKLIIDADPELEMHPMLKNFLWDSFDSERTEFLQKS